MIVARLDRRVFTNYIELMSDISVWSSVISDLFVNLSAGWLGVVFIASNISKKRGVEKFFVLTVDVLLAIFCLVVGYLLRR